MGHSIRAIIGKPSVAEALAARFDGVRRVPLSHGYEMVPLLDRLFDAMAFSAEAANPGAAVGGWSRLGAVAVPAFHRPRPIPTVRQIASGCRSMGVWKDCMPSDLLSKRLTVEAPVLVAEFEAIRARVRDSGVKGHENEEVVRRFVEQHLNCGPVMARAEVFDSHDKTSGEMDVVVCNEHQPLRRGPFLAEGVHAVIQVKAVLTSEELSRIQRNCASLKALRRELSIGDAFYRPGCRSPAEVRRIPYIVFCFESALSLDRVVFELTRQNTLASDVLDTPDALFVLRPGGTLINCRRADPPVLLSGSPRKPLFGWARMETGDSTVAALLRFLVADLPWVRRLVSPMGLYFGTHHPYPTYGFEPMDPTPSG